MERTWAKRTEELIEKALEEDIDTGDITTESTVPPDLVSTAFLFTREDGVLAGIDVAIKVFRRVDPGLEINAYFKDGDQIQHGQRIAEIKGFASSIMKAERTALNFVGRMTGIATKTAALVKQVEGCHAKILDTRKTAPTMRHLDKYAVRVGGGSNHRFGLFDMVLIKDNHIAISGGIRIATERVISYLKERNIQTKIEVECKSYEEVLEAVYTPIDIIMLDNMEIPEIEKSVNTIRTISVETGRMIRVEASGNVNGNNVRIIAETGVDYISIGALTHSVKNHDFSLLFAEL
ncbi:carboxylating nicotinate-nucleotide diphosphorylase [bacterium]|nr:carboxylating nicotinate-nucleotide diphosphorylase [bacterium]